MLPGTAHAQVSGPGASLLCSCVSCHDEQSVVHRQRRMGITSCIAQRAIWLGLFCWEAMRHACCAAVLAAMETSKAWPIISNPRIAADVLQARLQKLRSVGVALEEADEEA